MILPYEGVVPRLGDGVFVADNATVVGDVVLGAGASVWFGTVVRGDVNSIAVGAGTNLQDLVVVHVTSKTHPTRIGERVTVGHRAILHGCTVGDGCLIGMGAIVLDGAVVEAGAMVGAGALVPPGTVVPAGMLALGVPARVVRRVSEEEAAFMRSSAQTYADLARRYVEANDVKRLPVERP